MKILLATLLFLIDTFLSISSYAKETIVHTIGGKLSITEKENEFRSSNIVFNNIRLLPDDVMQIELGKKYRIGHRDIILISIANGANGTCPTQYYFVSIDSKKNTSISPSIDCHAEAKLITYQVNSKIIGTISKLNESGNDHYIFENGKLTENGKMLHK